MKTIEVWVVWDKTKKETVLLTPESDDTYGSCYGAFKTKTECERHMETLAYDYDYYEPRQASLEIKP